SCRTCLHGVGVYGPHEVDERFLQQHPAALGVRERVAVGHVPAALGSLGDEPNPVCFGGVQESGLDFGRQVAVRAVVVDLGVEAVELDAPAVVALNDPLCLVENGVGDFGRRLGGGCAGHGVLP